MAVQKGAEWRLSNVSAAFVEQNTLLRKFVARYFSNRQDIEDVVQEAYLRAYVAERKKSIEQPKAFLFRIAKNVALTNLSRKSRRMTDYLDDAELSAALEPAPSACQEAAGQELVGLYVEAVLTLPAKCREAFLLRKVHGLSHKEIARRMSLSLSSVEKYLRQGLQICDAVIAERENPGKP